MARARTDAGILILNRGMKEAAGAFPGRNELWGGRLLWLRERQSLVRQEHLLQLAKQTGRIQRESQSTRGRAQRGSAVLVTGPLRSILVELREADKNPGCGPISRGPSGPPLDLDNLAEGVVKPALLRCSGCKRRQTEHSDADHDFQVDEDTAHVALLVFSRPLPRIIAKAAMLTPIL